MKGREMERRQQEERENLVELSAYGKQKGVTFSTFG